MAPSEVLFFSATPEEPSSSRKYLIYSNDLPEKRVKETHQNTEKGMKEKPEKKDIPIAMTVATSKTTTRYSPETGPRKSVGTHFNY